MAVSIGVARESAPGERRVALTPETCRKLVAAGATVRAERGLGRLACFPDEAYAAAGATLVGDAAAALSGADVILAKGMANAETMLGCGYNVYYAFLVKCQRFVTRFGKPMFTPMLVKERE